MAKTAMTQLQDQVEMIRREAYEAGYAAAMQAVRDFAARPAAAEAVVQPNVSQRAGSKSTPRTESSGGRRRRAAAVNAAPLRRPPRGTNAGLVAEVLKAAGTAKAGEIRKTLMDNKGITLSFTSIRHALGQLASRNEAAATDDGKIWRYTGGAGVT